MHTAAIKKTAEGNTIKMIWSVQDRGLSLKGYVSFYVANDEYRFTHPGQTSHIRYIGNYAYEKQ